MTVDEKIADLEMRLLRYHEALAEAIQERDRLALDAAWGVHYALFTFIGVVSSIYAINRLVGDNGLIAGTLMAVAIVFAPLGIHVWSNGARMKEVDRLAKLPDWSVGH